MKIRFNKNDIISEKNHDRFKKFEKIKNKEKIKDKDKNKIKDKIKTSKDSSNNESNILDRDNFIIESSMLDLTDSSLIYAKVVEVHKKYCFVSSQKNGIINTHDIYLATIPKKHLQSSQLDRNFVCVGDDVVCKLDPTSTNNVSKDYLPQVTIINRIKRTNEIYRIDPFLKDRVHTIASNIDLLLIVSSFLSPKINWKFIDRYLVLAKYSEITPIIILNKKDLLIDSKKDDPDFYKSTMKKIEYNKSLGYKVLLIEANSSIKKQKQNPDFVELKKILTNKTALLSGQSGVGKSSILNLFNPEIIQAVEPNSDISYKGRHTTSFTSFIKIDVGYLIDTPGIRSFVVPELNSFYLANCFLDFIPFLDGCLYKSECSHNNEPDCMIKNKVKEGIIPEWRYQSYLNILLKLTGREGRFSLHSKNKNSYIDINIDDDDDNDDDDNDD